jgi:mRNA interferase MazF
MPGPPRPQNKTLAFPHRGEIYLVGFDPTLGHEIQKTRPALIIQNDVSNEYSPITIVAAISSKFSDPPFPREVVIDPTESGLPMLSAVIVNQIRSVDRQRLQEKVGNLSARAMARVGDAIKISLGLTDL